MAEVLRLGGKDFAPTDLIVLVSPSRPATEAQDSVLVSPSTSATAAQDSVLVSPSTSTIAAQDGVLVAGLDLTTDIEVARRTGAGLRTTDPAAALAAGLRPDGIVYDAGGLPTATRLRMLVADGWPVLVDVDTPPANAPDSPDVTDVPDVGGAPNASGVTEAIAAASVCAWLGARLFATQHVREVRQALDLIATIRGDRPPAVSRRGLA